MTPTFQDEYEDRDYSAPELDHSDLGPDPISSDHESDTEPAMAAAPPPMGPRAVTVLRILTFMDGHNMTLADFLDAISWGDPHCTLNAKIRNERTILLNSPELPGILRRWWKPPRPRKGKKARPKRARDVMQKFALESAQQVLEEELELLMELFKSPAGNDIKEDHLTGVSFSKMVAQVQKIAPNLWACLFRLARSASQQARNPQKKPANVSF